MNKMQQDNKSPTGEIMHLPSNWVYAPLGNICAKISDGSHNPPKAQESGKPMLSARNISGRKIIFDDYRLISESDFATEDLRTQVGSGNVLLTIVGAIGRTAVIPTEFPPFTLQRSVAVLKIRAGDPRFLSYALESPAIQSYLQENAKGTAQKGIYLKALAGVEIPVSPLPEQTRIADKLDAVLARVDAVNTRLARVAPILKRFRQSVLAAATSGRLTEDWRVLQSEKVSSSSMLLSQLCRKITDGEHISPQKTAYGIPLLTAKNVTQNGVSFEETHFVSEEDAKTFWLRCKPEPGDTLICSRGTIGRSAQVDTIRPFCLMGTVILLKPDTSLIHQSYLSIAIAAPKTQEAMRGASGATAVSALYLKDIKQLAIDVPTLTEQTEIVRRVETLFAFADRLEARLQAAQTAAERLTPALLAKAFRGELVPQDPNDEPASELLRRLQASPPVSAPKRGRKPAA